MSQMDPYPLPPETPLAFTFIGRVRIEGGTLHFDAHRLVIDLTEDGRVKGWRVEEGDALDLLPKGDG